MDGEPCKAALHALPQKLHQLQPPLPVSQDIPGKHGHPVLSHHFGVFQRIVGALKELQIITPILRITSIPRRQGTEVFLSSVFLLFAEVLLQLVK